VFIQGRVDLMAVEVLLIRSKGNGVFVGEVDGFAIASAEAFRLECVDEEQRLPEDVVVDMEDPFSRLDLDDLTVDVGYANMGSGNRICSLWDLAGQFVQCS
jgi:hypothetical protein